MHTNRAIFSNIRVIFVYFQKRQGKPSTLLLSSCALKLICFLERGWHSANVSFRTMSKFSKISLLTLKCPALHSLCFFFFLCGHKGPPSGENAVGLKQIKFEGAWGKLLSQPVYSMFISNNYASFHLWWKKKLVKN